ncbi:MAG: YceI family protein [Hyphomonas sp.]
MARWQETLTRPRRRQLAAACLLALSTLPGCSTLAGAVLKPAIDTAASSVPAGDYALDKAHASILFKIDHLGYSTYVGRFERFDASLSGDPESPETATVSAIVDISSLDIANPEFAAELLGPDWFDAATYPTASFRTSGLDVTGVNQADIRGDLTLRGKTREVTLKARLNGSAYDRLRGADVVGFSAKLAISRSAFGLGKYSGLLTDEVWIEIEAEFVRTPPG